MRDVVTQLYEFGILVNQKPISEYYHEGNFFVEGRKGSQYELFFRNHSAIRVLVIASVDGLSVMNGKPAGAEGPGYVVEPRGYLSVPGWTKDNSEVNAFYFSSIPKSYSSRTGQGSNNVGVVGAMVFPEHQKPQWHQTYDSYHLNGLNGFKKTQPIRRYGASGQSAASGLNSLGSWTASGFETTSLNAQNAGMEVNTSARSFTGAGATGSISAAAAMPVANAVGTGWGHEMDFKTTNVIFEKASANPVSTMAIFYDDRKGLVKRGVLIDYATNKPNPFPKTNRVGCEPPRN
jgi:hypothetical protein